MLFYGEQVSGSYPNPENHPRSSPQPCFSLLGFPLGLDCFCLGLIFKGTSWFGDGSEMLTNPADNSELQKLRSGLLAHEQP